ncbi:MAG: hypothetical protein ABH834_07025 [Candidatus Altiarchaeota archaeon]
MGRTTTKRVSDAVLALSRFDSFNTDRGGKPTAFDGRFGRYLLAVRDYEGDTRRRIEVVHGEHLAGFIDELKIKGTQMEAGAYGWVGVLDYPQIYSGLQDRSASSYGITYAANQLLSDWDNPDNLGGYMNLAVLLRHAADKAQRLDTDPEKIMESLVTSDALNYEGDGAILNGMLEFVSVLALPGTRWKLTDIGNKKTQDKLLSGRPFDRTGLGRRFTMNGWVTTPHAGEDCKRASPLVVKQEGYCLRENWVNLGERIKALPG